MLRVLSPWSLALVAAVSLVGAWQSLATDEPGTPPARPLERFDAGRSMSREASVNPTGSSGLTDATSPSASALSPATTGQPSPSRPTWLWGQTDLSPAGVLQAWHAYARTQGPVYDTAQELIDYARQHPQRVAGSNGLTHDAWLDAIAQDPAGRDIAQRMLASGYLDTTLERSLDQYGPGVDTVRNQEAAADLRTLTRCSHEDCTMWAALLALSPDHAVVAFNALGRAARQCGAPQSQETFLRAAEAYGNSTEAANAQDWAARKRLALKFAPAAPVSCSG